MSKPAPRTLRDVAKQLRQRRSVESRIVRKILDRTPNVKQYFNLNENYKKEYLQLVKIYKTSTQGMSKQEKQSSRAKVDLPGGKVEIRSLEKFMSGKSNFRQIKNIVDKLMPSLRDSYQYGHSNISVLRANIALALNEDSKESFLSPNERKQILVLYQLAQKIDKITNAEGYDKDVLINQLGDIAEAGPEIKASWKKDIKIITGVSGKIEIEAEYTALNQFKGNLAAWVGEIFASVIREDDRLFNKYLSEIDIYELQGSPTIVQDVESALISVFST